MDDCIPLKKFIANNHIGTVIDLEERGKIEVAKFMSGTNHYIDYLEVDASYINVQDSEVKFYKFVE